MTDKEYEAGLYEVIRIIYEKYLSEPMMSPSWMATQAMIDIAFPRELHSLGYLGCHLQFRQIARGFLRKHCDPVEVPQSDLFPETLQERYPRRPRKGEEEPVYVLLDLMTEDDADFNIERLRIEARAKAKHADALEAWKEQRCQQRTA